MVVREVHRQWRSIGEAIDLVPGKSVTISLWNESETQPSLMQPGSRTHSSDSCMCRLVSDTHTHSDTPTVTQTLTQ